MLKNQIQTLTTTFAATHASTFGTPASRDRMAGLCGGVGTGVVVAGRGVVSVDASTRPSVDRPESLMI